ncbi:MAG: hypothetical protein ACLTAC_34320 [Hungatella sp.]
MEKAQYKADKAGRKLESAREKLASQKPQKRPGLAKKAVRGVRAEVWFYTHNKIHEVEHENVGVEGTHKSELVAEAGTRKLVRFADAATVSTRPAGWRNGNGRSWRHGPIGFQKMARNTRSLPATALPHGTEMETENASMPDRQDRPRRTQAAKKQPLQPNHETGGSGGGPPPGIYPDYRGTVPAVLYPVSVFPLSPCWGAALSMPYPAPPTPPLTATF